MLFDHFTINGKLELGNRIVMAPLYTTWDGRSDEFRAFYVRRAQGGVGLVIAPQSSPSAVDDWDGSRFRRAVPLAHRGLPRGRGQDRPAGLSRLWRRG